MDVLGKKRLLITGVSGLLGNNLAYALRDRYDIMGLFHHYKVNIPGIRSQGCDLSDQKKIKEIVDSFVPDTVIHTAAISNIDVCENKQELAYDVNVNGTKNILKALRSVPSKYIYISTDNFYHAQKDQPLRETDLVDPLNAYGRMKHDAEQESLAYDNALIIRTNFFGWNIQPKHSLAEWILHELGLNRSINGFTDAVFSSIYTFDLAKVMEKILESDLKGVYNLGSRTSLSKYEFALALARLFKFDVALIKPVTIEEHLSLTAKRRGFLALNVDKLEKDLGIQLPTIEESLKHFAEDAVEGLPTQIKSGYYPQMDVISYGRQMIDENDIQSVVDVMKSTHLTQGAKVREFEAELCRVTGSDFCVAVNTGTAALHLACLAMDIEEGDEVITSPISFVASANCAAYCQGTPVFADIDPQTYCVTPKSIEEKITSKTKAVIPVHFAGQSCAMEEIQQLVQRKEKEYGHRIYIIEDAAHALGSYYKNRPVGCCQFSDMSIMSFHPVKHITTGEGGAVYTNNEKLYRKVKFFSSHGITSDQKKFVRNPEAYLGTTGQRKQWYYEQQYLGYNFRITDIQCALGLSQLKKLSRFVTRRREIVNYYNQAFKDLRGVSTPQESVDCDSNFHLYVLLIDFAAKGFSREELIEKLWARRIRPQVHYIPIYTQPFYEKTFGTQWGLCPAAEKYYEQCLSIPLYPLMSRDDVEYVIATFKELLG